MGFPAKFKPYIDEETYKDTSIALDILIHNHCPLYLQAEYIINHPSVEKKANRKVLYSIANEIDRFNEKVKVANQEIYYRNHPFEVNHFEPKLIKRY